MANGREYTKEDMEIAVKQLCNEVQDLADSERNINMKQFNDYSFMHQLRKMVGKEQFPGVRILSLVECKYYLGNMKMFYMFIKMRDSWHCQEISSVIAAVNNNKLENLISNGEIVAFSDDIESFAEEMGIEAKDIETNCYNPY